MVEILMVVAIIGVLLGIVTYQFGQNRSQSLVEKQTRQLYGDIMEIRSRALFEKRPRGIRLTTTSYQIYSSGVLSGSPIETRPLKMPITWNNNAELVYRTDGLTFDMKTICVAESNAGTVDSIVVSASRVQIGKLDEGASCVQTNVKAK